LEGELIEDVQGALWKRAELEALRTNETFQFDRVVVAVDPPAAKGAGAATCGIIAAGAYRDGQTRRAVVLADASIQGAAPNEWAARVAAVSRSVSASVIIAEANNGGEMVRAVLRAAAPDCVVRLVHASKNKRMRAEPVSMHYAKGLVKHAAAFPALEDEMCAFGDGLKESPDRVDALVWAITELLAGRGDGPSIRVL
jgi:phage terminase large subunit-like protein